MTALTASHYDPQLDYAAGIVPVTFVDKINQLKLVTIGLSTATQIKGEQGCFQETRHQSD